MKKWPFIFPALLLMVCAVAFALHLLCTHGRKREQPLVKVRQLPQERTQLLYTEIREKGDYCLTSDGCRVSMPPNEHPRDLPLAVIVPLRRDTDGKVMPFAPSALYFRPQVPGLRISGTGTRPLDGATSLCVGVTPDPQTGALQMGQVYIVQAYDDDLPPAQPLLSQQALLTLPEQMQRGQVLTFELLLKDDIREQERQAAERAQAEMLARAVEEETLVITFQGVPKHSPDTTWCVNYYAPGSHSREVISIDVSHPIRIKGPNPVGGELTVTCDDPELPRTWLWAQIAHLKNRTVTLPANADWVIDDEKLITVRLAFAPDDRSAVAELWTIAFYADESLQRSLFWASPRNVIERQATAPVELKALPGTFYAKAVLKGRKEPLPLGPLEITNEPGKTYVLKLPATK